MSDPAAPLRIGDVAKLVGTTPRTIRYYEELGLLPNVPGRPSGGHRMYTTAEVERLRETIRLKELLGVTLQELKDLLAAEEARAAVRAQLRRDDVRPERRRELLEEARGHLDRQIELVEHRAAELAKLHEELSATRARVRRKLRETQAMTQALTKDAGSVPQAITKDASSLPQAMTRNAVSVPAPSARTAPETNARATLEPSARVGKVR